MDPGEPQTILLLGSDKRPSNPAEHRPLGHDHPAPVGPRAEPTSLMSLPRDLKAEIPGHGTDKFNAAYDDGGPDLTTANWSRTSPACRSTMWSTSTSAASSARSTRSAASTWTSTGATTTRTSAPPDKYADINIQPGYQRLCGQKRSSSCASATTTPTWSARRASRRFLASHQQVSLDRPDHRQPRHARHLRRVHDLRRVKDRSDLIALLNLLCSPRPANQRGPLPGPCGITSATQSRRIHP